MADSLRDGQRCFVSNGFMFCNFIIRNGKIVKSKNGLMRFPIGYKRKEQKTKSVKDLV